MKLHFRASLLRQMHRRVRHPLAVSLVLGGTAAFCVTAFEGCGGGKANGAYSTSEIAEALVSGTVNSTEPGGTQSSSYPAIAPQGRFARFAELFSLIPDTRAATACPVLTGVTCDTGNIKMVYSSCTFPGSATVWNGYQNLFQSAGCTGTITLASLNATTIKRTFGLNTTETTSAGVVTTLDTVNAAASGWDTLHVSGLGNGVSVQFTSTAGNRTVTILGVHLTGIDSASGNTAFDQTVSSGGLPVTGAGVTRALGSGVITVQSNLSQYSAQVNVTTPLAYSMAGCCHPASGVLTTQLSGSRDGIETLTFTGGATGTCGTATFTDASRNKADITLSHCF